MNEAIKKAATKSWQTTAVGWIGAVAMILGGVHAQFDGDPVTVVNWFALIPAAAACAGIGTLSRDHGVSSAAAGVN